MGTVLIRTLLLLGCNDKQVRFYTANLELGAASLTEIAQKARLQRSTAYIIAAELCTSGLVTQNHKTYKKLFVAAEPDLLLQKLEAKHRKIGRNNLALKEVLPELRATYQTTTTRPRVRTYEGRSELGAVWKDILAEPQEVLLWTNQESEEHVFGPEAHNMFINERMARGIPIRVLAVNNPSGRALTRTDTSALRTTKLLPQNVTFTTETYVYGDKVAVLDIGKDVFAVITENAQIASSQRAMFELAWAHV